MISRAIESRWVLGLTIALFMGLCVVSMSSCTTSPAVRHLSADQNGLTEAGRSMATAEMTIRLYERYHALDPERWREIAMQSGRLSQDAGHLITSRAGALTGDVSECEHYYAGINARMAAIRTQREQLENDVFDAMPK